ncbi:MAG: MarR family transcriptional regulator [Ruminococcaceae bacterium]|nr:MarR family transcriptional regulator [Oscillospiraceae bacterium]
MNREKDIGFTVRRLSNLIKRDVEKSRARLGLDPIKGINGWAIAYLYENRDKDIFQKDFEEKFSIRRSTASNILKTMEQKELIERVSVKEDARLKKIVLTEKAIELHKRITQEINAREKRLREGISQEELGTFFKVMQKLSANMEDKND